MAVGPALQRTGTQMLAAARYWAQDQSSTAPAVSAADGLERLNDRLIWWQYWIAGRPKTLASTTTGLSFAAGDVSKVVTDQLGIQEILWAHPATDSTVVYPLSQPLKRISIEEMFGNYYNAGNLFGGSATDRGPEWQAYAYEMDQTQQDDIVVFVWPPLNRAANLTIRCKIVQICGVIGDTVDISPMGSRMVERMLGYDMAGVQKQNDPVYLQWILSGVPANIQAAMFGDAKNLGGQPAQIRDYGSASR